METENPAPFLHIPWYTYLRLLLCLLPYTILIFRKTHQASRACFLWKHCHGCCPSNSLFKWQLKTGWPGMAHSFNVTILLSALVVLPQLLNSDFLRDRPHHYMLKHVWAQLPGAGRRLNFLFPLTVVKMQTQLEQEICIWICRQKHFVGLRKKKKRKKKVSYKVSFNS